MHPSRLKAEVVILASALRHPELLLPDMANLGDLEEPSLRAAMNELECGKKPAWVIRQIEPDTLRCKVLDVLAEMEQAGEEPSHQRLAMLLRLHAAGETPQ